MYAPSALSPSPPPPPPPPPLPVLSAPVHPSNPEDAIPTMGPQTKTQTKFNFICSTDDEDDILHAFFAWEKETLKKLTAKERMDEVWAIVEREMWSVNDLKDMSMPNSFNYLAFTWLGKGMHLGVLVPKKKLSPRIIL